MDIIIKSRAHGKTRDLVKMSSENNIPIVSSNPNYIKDMAKNMGLSIPEPISYSNHLIKSTSVYIDELALFLQHIGYNCEAFTITLDD